MKRPGRQSQLAAGVAALGILSTLLVEPRRMVSDDENHQNRRPNAARSQRHDGSNVGRSCKSGAGTDDGDR